MHRSTPKEVRAEAHPLRVESIRGTWGTVLLPINRDDSIDWARLQDELDVLGHSGLHGLYTNGTAGEFYAQAPREFERINDMAALVCGKNGLNLQIGASHPCASESLARLRRARQWNPVAFQVVLPDWSPVSMEEAVGFVARMADEAAPVPLVVYNPPHAKRVLTPSEWGTIVAVEPRIAGIKVAGGDADWYDAMRVHAPGVSIFVAGHRLASGVQRGAHGSYSNMACMQPTAAAAWWRQMQVNPDGAIELERRIASFIDTCIVPLIGPDRYSNQAADKLLAAIGGWADIGTRLRWPYRGLDPAEAVRLRAIARERIPEFVPGA